jgi:DNA-binding Lrp family transcriptional regulator
LTDKRSAPGPDAASCHRIEERATRRYGGYSVNTSATPWPCSGETAMPCGNAMQGTPLARSTSRVAARLAVRKHSAAKQGCGRIVASIHKLVSSIPEVMEFYRMAGLTDYLLRIVVPDIAAYDRVYKRMINAADLGDVTSSFAMEQIKFTTRLPLDYVDAKT